MQLEPNHLLPVAIPTEGLKVSEVTRIKRAKHVEEHTATPDATAPDVPKGATANITVEEEKRHDPHVHGERRIFCRRIEQAPILIDLRYGFDRRRVNQREDDLTEHVDEVA